MSVAWQFYISTVLIYLGVDVIACWGLNLQFGVAGLVNFAFIIFQAAGAYTAAILTLGPAQPASQGGFQQYVGGAHWPFPLPILAAGLVGGLLAALVGGFTVRRLRSDYEAMVMLVVSLIATSVATNQVGLVNGPNGLALVPKPLSTLVNLSPIGYQWLFVGITAAICVCVYWLVHIVTSSPLGRTLRAVRDNDQAAAALGKNVTGLRMLAFILGGVIAGISGAVLVSSSPPGPPVRGCTRKRSCTSPPSSWAGPATTWASWSARCSYPSPSSRPHDSCLSSARRGSSTPCSGSSSVRSPSSSCGSGPVA